MNIPVYSLNDYVRKTEPHTMYRLRGWHNRTTKVLKREFEEYKRQRRLEPVPQEYFDHVGGPIEVTTYWFDNEMGEFREIVQVGLLAEVDADTKYCTWQLDDRLMSPVYFRNIKLLSRELPGDQNSLDPSQEGQGV